MEHAFCILRSYLSVVRPLIIASFGGKAATVARTKFRTRALCFATISPPPNSDMMIGSVAMEYYDTANEEAFLHVPLMHPGSLQIGVTILDG